MFLGEWYINWNQSTSKFRLRRNYPLSCRNSFLFQGLFSLNNNNFWQCSIIPTSSSSIWWCSFVKEMLFFNMLSEDAVLLNHSITVLEFFYWLLSRCFTSAWLIFSRQGELAWKFSLWSFRVIRLVFLQHILLF